MQLAFLGLLAFWAGVTRAHFRLLYPPPRGVFVSDNEPNFCGKYSVATICETRLIFIQVVIPTRSVTEVSSRSRADSSVSVQGTPDLQVTYSELIEFLPIPDRLSTSWSVVIHSAESNILRQLYV